MIATRSVAEGRLRALGLLLGVLLGVLSQAPACAEDKGTHAHRDRAKAVRRAVRNQDTTALATLAAQRDIDPWWVVLALEELNAPEAARAYAAAVDGSPDGALARYVARQRVPDMDKAERDRYQTALKALLAQEPDRVLEILAAPPEPAGDVIGHLMWRQRGEAYILKGARKEAMAALQLAADTAARIGWRDAAVDTLTRAAWLAQSFGDLARALELLAVALAHAELHGDPNILAGTHSRIAAVHAEARRMPEVVRHAELALEHARRGTSRVLVATTVDVGIWYLSAGDPDRAEVAFRSGLQLAEAGDYVLFRSHALVNLGVVHVQQGRPDEARSVLEQALPIKESLGDRVGLARLHIQLGNVEQDVGRPAVAAERYLSALAHLPDSAEHNDLRLTCHHKLVMTRAYQGSATESDAAYATAEALVRRLERPEWLGSLEETRIEACLHLHRFELVQQLGEWRLAQEGATLAPAARANVHRQLGVALSRRGRASEALEHLIIAAEAFERIQDDAAASVVRVLIADHFRRLAVLGVPSDEARRARAEAEHAERLATRSGSLVARGQVQTFLGMLLGGLEDLSAAEDRVRGAVADLTAARDWTRLVRARCQLGDILASGGRLAEADDLLADAIELAQRIHDPAGLAEAQRGRADVCVRQGKPDESLALLEQALQSARMSRHIRMEGLVLRDMARLALGQGDTLRCMELAREATAISAFDSRSGVTEAALLADADQASAAATLGLAAAVQAADVAAAYAFLELGRAEALQRLLQARDGPLPRDTPPALRQEDDRARSEEAQAIARWREAAASRDKARIPGARAEAEAARVRRRDVLARVLAASREGLNLARSESPSLSALQTRLGPNGALLVYTLALPTGHVLVVDAKGARLVALGPSASLRGLVGDVISPKAGAIDWAASVPALRERLVRPLQLGPNVLRVYVSPHEELAALPFCLLLPDAELVMVPSATTFHLLRNSSASGTRVLGLGHPDYRAEPTVPKQSALRSGLRLRPLPATRDEVLAVADTHLLGSAATEVALRKALASAPRWRAVHLACHGIVDSEQSLLAALALTPQGDDDGFLTVEEILTWHVPADLVVLSACQSARGRVTSSEGVLGLTRAFLAAGASGVLSSLWDVDDDATRALMVTFYESWNPRTPGTAPLSAREALRRAQAAVRTQPRWKDPQYWAAWTLWGGGE